MEFIAGNWTTCLAVGRQKQETLVRLEDVFDVESLDRIDHTNECSYCRRLWTTLQFLTVFANDQVWAGLVAEFLKILASTGVQSEFN